MLNIIGGLLAFAFGIFSTGFFIGNSVPRMVPTNKVLSMVGAAAVVYAGYSFKEWRKKMSEDNERKALRQEYNSGYAEGVRVTENAYNDLKRKNDCSQLLIEELVKYTVNYKKDTVYGHYRISPNQVVEQTLVMDEIGKYINTLRDEMTGIITMYTGYTPVDLTCMSYRNSRGASFSIEQMTLVIRTHFRQLSAVRNVLDQKIMEFSFSIKAEEPNNIIETFKAHISDVLNLGSFQCEEIQTQDVSLRKFCFTKINEKRK